MHLKIVTFADPGAAGKCVPHSSCRPADLDTDEHSLRRAHNRPVPRPGSRAERRLAALRMRVAEKRILKATIEEAGRWLEGAAGYGTGTSLHDEL